MVLYAAVGKKRITNKLSDLQIEPVKSLKKIKSKKKTLKEVY